MLSNISSSVVAIEIHSAFQIITSSYVFWPMNLDKDHILMVYINTTKMLPAQKHHSQQHIYSYIVNKNSLGLLKRCGQAK